MVVITLGFESLRSGVRIAFAIRPEANSDLRKWTAHILQLRRVSCGSFNAASNLRDLQPAGFLAGELRVPLFRGTTHGGLSWRILNGFAM